MHNNKKIFLPSFGKHIAYSIDDIIYLVADNHYTNLYSANTKNEPISISIPLKQIEEISNNSNFFRCNRSYIINLNYVTEFSLRENKIKLNNKFEIPLSDKCKEQFINKLKKNSKIAFVNGGGNTLIIRNIVYSFLHKIFSRTNNRINEVYYRYTHHFSISHICS